jgi:GAF domain-containing protein
MVASELRHDQRWPHYVPRAVAQGVRSQMGLRLFIESHTLGGLNLYSTQADTIDPDLQHVAELFASHASSALGKARQVQDLETALQARKVIGQAIGMVMERYELNEDRAFQFLVRVSSHSNVKLRDIAQELVDQANFTRNRGRPVS